MRNEEKAKKIVDSIFSSGFNTNRTFYEMAYNAAMTMAEWKDRQYPHWNRQDENDIYDSFDDWNYHRYVCIMKDGQVSTWGAILDEHYDGSIEKHINPIEGDYSVDDILYWTELEIKNNI